MVMPCLITSKQAKCGKNKDWKAGRNSHCGGRALFIYLFLTSFPVGVEVPFAFFHPAAAVSSTPPLTFALFCLFCFASPRIAGILIKYFNISGRRDRHRMLNDIWVYIYYHLFIKSLFPPPHPLSAKIFYYTCYVAGKAL